MQMDDQDVKSQLKEERHKVKALRKIIRDYELKIVQLSHQLNTLKDRLGPRSDKDSSKEQIQEAVIRELMNTIEDLHKTIVEKDRTIYQLTEETRKHKLIAFDQQPPSSLKEGNEQSFASVSSSLNDSEPLIILDDDTIKVNSIITTATETATKLNGKSSSTNHMISSNRSRSPPANPSTSTSTPAPAAISNDMSHKNQKSNTSCNNVTTKNLKTSTSTPTTSSITIHRPSSSSNILFHSANTSKSRNSNSNDSGTPNLMKSTLDDKISSQNTTIITDNNNNNNNKKRKIPCSLSISSTSTSSSTSKLKQAKLTKTNTITNDENDNSNKDKKEYAFVEHSKSKHERAKMVGNTCTCCQYYYRDDVPLRQVDTNKQLTSEERIQLHSRHRTKYEPPKTPPGFWELDFPSFDEDFGKF